MSINLAFIVLVYLGRSLNCTLLIFSVFIAFFALIAIVYYLRPAPRLFVARSTVKETGQLKQSSKLVTLTKDSILEQKN